MPMCIISCRYYCLYTLLMSVGSLFAVFSLLFSRTAAVGTRDVFLFLGLGLHLVVIILFRAPRTAAEVDALNEYLFEIIHIRKGVNPRSLLAWRDLGS